jgi:signal transduction histidine kinase
MKADDLRDTGISVLGRMPWATHVSLFYETRGDLLDTLVPYFKAGLKGRELCVWLWSEPALKRVVETGLRAALPAFDEHVERGKIVFVDGRAWLRASRFDRAGLIRTWADLAERARTEGYAGLRAAGDHTWLGHQDWRDFSRFEETLHAFVANRRIIFVCTYPLRELRATDILDSARAHHLAIARRRGTWDVLERPSLKATKEQIQRRNQELEHTIAERTRQLAQAKRTSHERAVEARYKAVFEERLRLAREIHDSLLQGLTGIALKLRATLPRLEGSPGTTTESIRAVAELAESTSRDARRVLWDMRAPSLTEKGLAAALAEALPRTAGTVALGFTARGKPKALPFEVDEAIFRIAQESTLNAVKHADAATISVELTYKARGVELRVTDDGCGFRAGRPAGTDRGGWGLQGMRERAQRIGGSLVIRAAPGGGTIVILRVTAGRRQS